MQKLNVDPEFQKLCPPLSESERAALKESIESEGCRDAIVVWNGTIVDGHNRYDICQELKKPFETKSIELADRQAAAEWILSTQLARRNLSKLQASYLRGTLYNRLKLDTGHKTGKGKTVIYLSRQLGVGARTLFADSEFAEAVEHLTPEARAMFLDTKIAGKGQYIIDLAQLSPKSQRFVVESIEEGVISHLSKAILKLRPSAKTGSHSTKCPTCGARMAAGVTTCLKCDLTDKEVRKRLTARERIEVQAATKVTPPQSQSREAEGWESRLASLQAAKKSGDEFVFHIDWLRRYLEENSAAELSYNETQKLKSLKAALDSVLMKRAG